LFVIWFLNILNFLGCLGWKNTLFTS